MANVSQETIENQQGQCVYIVLVLLQSLMVVTRDIDASYDNEDGDSDVSFNLSKSQTHGNDIIFNLFHKKNHKG